MSRFERRWARGLEGGGAPTYTRLAVSRLNAFVVLRAVTLGALAAAAALAVDYRSLDSAFCGAESGCAELRQTQLAHLWGIGVTLPELGGLGLLLLFALSFTRARLLCALLAVVAGIVSVVLMALQGLLWHRFCWLCVTVDVSALLAGFAGLYWLAWPSPRSEPLLASWAWWSLAALVIAAPLAWPSLRPAPDVPAAVRAHYQANKINVVEFADFECPFCRDLYPRLKALLAPYGDRVNFVRLNMPLDAHPHARDAALAALCVEPEKSEALAEFLFTTEDLSRASIGRAAAALGVERAAFDACRASAATQQRLRREMDSMSETGLRALPTTYVGAKRIVGAQSNDIFRAALESADAHDDEGGVPSWLYLGLSIALGALLVGAGYRRAERAATSETRARLAHGEYRQPP